MAMPKKNRDWRKINVDGHAFRWKFDSDEKGGWVLVRRDESGSASVKIEIPWMKDPWINIREEMSPNIVSVTPKIVSDLIRKAKLSEST